MHMVRLLLILAKLYLFFYILAFFCTQNKNINQCQNYKHICKQFKPFYKTKINYILYKPNQYFISFKKNFTDIFDIL